MPIVAIICVRPGPHQVGTHAAAAQGQTLALAPLALANPSSRTNPLALPTLRMLLQARRSPTQTPRDVPPGAANPSPATPAEVEASSPERNMPRGGHAGAADRSPMKAGEAEEGGGRSPSPPSMRGAPRQGPSRRGVMQRHDHDQAPSASPTGAGGTCREARSTGREARSTGREARSRSPTGNGTGTAERDHRSSTDHDSPESSAQATNGHERGASRRRP